MAAEWDRRRTEMSELDVEAGGLKRTFKDLFAGAAGGVAQVLLGQYSVGSGS